MGTISLEDIKVFAYHGLFDVEQKVGQWYVINVDLDYDFKDAIASDDLTGTIDYSKVNEIVLQEMSVSSKLIEHVAGRISKKIKTTYPSIQKGKMSIQKLNPPVKGVVKSVKVALSF